MCIGKNVHSQTGLWALSIRWGCWWLGAYIELPLFLVFFFQICNQHHQDINLEIRYDIRMFIHPMPGKRFAYIKQNKNNFKHTIRYKHYTKHILHNNQEPDEIRTPKWPQYKYRWSSMNWISNHLNLKSLSMTLDTSALSNLFLSSLHIE